jgi:hypothetical protein
MRVAIVCCGGLLLSLFGAQETRAAETADTPRIEDLCKTIWTDCRRNLTVQFLQANGSEYKKTFPLTYPPVQNKTQVTVFVGETVRLVAKVEGDRIAELAPASPGDNASQILEISLSQQKGKPDMMLVIKNPFDRPLKYKAGMQVPPDNDPAPTSVCPVLAGKMGIELWPYPVFQVFLSDFRFLPSIESEGAKCE